MADNGHYGKRRKGVSRQGIYVFTASGKFLSSVNTLSADIALKTISEGLEKWNQLPDSEKQRKTEVNSLPKHRFEHSYPADGLVLTGYSRDISPGASPDSERLLTWNGDAAWFSKSEMESLIPPDAKVGQTFDLPVVFVDRLAKLHFVDLTKGQTEPFAKSEIGGSKIQATVTARNSEQVSIALAGETRGVVPNGPNARGVEVKIIGYAIWNLNSKTFEQFEFVALGERWGKTRFNDRREQTDRTPIGYVFELASPEATPIIPGIIWAYDASWIVYGER